MRSTDAILPRQPWVNFDRRYAPCYIYARFVPHALVSAQLVRRRIDRIGCDGMPRVNPMATLRLCTVNQGRNLDAN
jgi:hypothetical protein